MNCEVIREAPLYYYGGCCPDFGQQIEIYADELKKVEVGKEWSCDDQDRYPNATEYWNVYVKKVFEDEHGCLLIKRDDYHERTCHEIPNPHEAIWIEYR